VNEAVSFGQIEDEPETVVPTETPAVLADSAADKVLLFTTKTCPNCRVAKPMLDKAGVQYEVIDAEEQADLSRSLDIRQAPTLVTMHGEDAHKYAGVQQIRAYIASVKGED